MSDVSFASAGWFGKALLIAGVFIFGAIQQMPKLTNRRRWDELREKEAAYDLAVQRIGENQQLRTALEHVRSIIKDGAMTGFNCHDGDWAERLFASQGVTYNALRAVQQRVDGK